MLNVEIDMHAELVILHWNGTATPFFVLFIVWLFLSNMSHLRFGAFTTKSTYLVLARRAASACWGWKV